MKPVFILALAVAACVAGPGRRTPHLSFIFNIYSEPMKDVPGPQKNYSGFRLREDSDLLIYHSEQTVAVVELIGSNQMINCELLEVRTDADKMATLEDLRPRIPVQVELKFKDMLQLMAACQKLEIPDSMARDRPKMADHRLGPTWRRKTNRKNADEVRRPDLTSVFSGVFPGTKWCGVGDIAQTYHDLGNDEDVDRCCRAHDLCPIKVLGSTTKYNLTNYAVYTKSHCQCDSIFYKCLKLVGSATADFLGHLYFNVVEKGCVNDLGSKRYTTAEKVFASWRKQY